MRDIGRMSGTYAIVGVGLSVLHYAISIATILYFHYSIETANMLAFILCTVMSYLLNGHFTFNSKYSAASLLKYVAVSVMTLISIPVFGYVFGGLGLSVYITQLIVQIMISILVFFANALFVFRKTEL